MDTTLFERYFLLLLAFKNLKSDEKYQLYFFKLANVPKIVFLPPLQIFGLYDEKLQVYSILNLCYVAHYLLFYFVAYSVIIVTNVYCFPF